jgi:hypothetical protein
MQLLARFLVVMLVAFAIGAAGIAAGDTKGAKPADTKKVDGKTYKKVPAAKTGTANSTPATGTTSSPGAVPPPAPTKSAASKSESTFTPPPSPGMVWVNPETKVYHGEGSRWYGKTKNGKYMTEADAIKAGYRAPKK